MIYSLYILVALPVSIVFALAWDWLEPYKVGKDE